ncbi:DNA replication ATP-dependent helicase/nuclease DNA2 isoform X2 [Carassius auratus]|uniref:DNA replication ATP-dependent helicase/nuclease DNA2 isoform X2 n=1 Tax=Carassius auratus TaxID=7957 RepID=A0A6P6QMQ2_CARAU|nr:DNA replication ATP-dependent helicase/nuclease DNA2-like isoform X2 [Carassius auratus]
MLNGTIVHDIFQKAAMSSDVSPERIQTFAAEALRSPSYLRQMYSLKLTQADMRQEVEEYLPSLSEWAKHYVHTSPLAGQKQLTLKLATVTDFVDIEENMWCPLFGLKGKMDVTAGVRIHRRGRKPTERIVPMELKTGKESNSIEHRSQLDAAIQRLAFLSTCLLAVYILLWVTTWTGEVLILSRLNVTISRAKHKLLMLGSAPTLRRYAPLEKLLSHLQQEDMISFTSVYE